jgi:ABC-type xylose transport system permease subunit
MALVEAVSRLSMKPSAICDVTERVTLSGKHGLFVGSMCGFVLGASLAVNPFTNGGLTFGVFGTFIICIVEGACFGGEIGVLIAALSGPTSYRPVRNANSQPR